MDVLLYILFIAGQTPHLPVARKAVDGAVLKEYIQGRISSVKTLLVSDSKKSAR